VVLTILQEDALVVKIKVTLTYGILLPTMSMLEDMRIAHSHFLLTVIVRYCLFNKYFVLRPFQIIDHFSKSRCIIFAMHLHKYYVYIHDKNYVSRFAKTTYNLERREYNLCPTGEKTCSISTISSAILFM